MILEHSNDDLPYDNGHEVSFSGKTDDTKRVVPAIEFRDVSLAFDDQVVLDSISFRVKRGETKIILGGSGTGKSTIINIVLGLIKPDSGQVIIDGEDITDYDEIQMMAIRKK